MKAAVFAIALYLLWGAVSVSGTEWFVSSKTGSDVEDCTNSKRPCQTIRRAVEQAETGDVINVAPSDDVNGECTSGPITIRKSLTFTTAGFQSQEDAYSTGRRKRAVVDCNGGKIAFDTSNCSQAGGPCKVSFVGFVFRNVTTAVNAVNASLDVASSSFHCVRNEGLEFFPNWPYCIHVDGTGNSTANVTIRDSNFANLTNGALKVSDAKSVELSNVKFTSCSPSASPTFEKSTYSLIDLLYLRVDVAEVAIHDCYFYDNTNYVADIFARASAYEQHVHFTVSNTTFDFSVNGTGQRTLCYPRALHIFETSTFGGFEASVRNCSFLNHPSTVLYVRRSSSYGITVDFEVEDSLFTFVPSDVHKCKIEAFENHLQVLNSKITFRNCVFVKKTDFNRVLYMAGSECRVVGCTFDSQEARGGNLIYSTGGDRTRGDLVLENTSITSANCSSGHNIGDVLYSIGPGRLALRNSSITVAYNTPGNLIFVAVDMYLTWENSSLICPEGYGAESLTPQGSSSDGTLFVACTPCPSGRYTLDSGSYTGSRSAREGTFTCQECPYGARCDGKTVSVLPNFWGTVTESRPRQIEMVLCPPGYCCSILPCGHVSSCSNNRTGRLCGECLDGFTRQLYSARCVPVGDCRYNDFWISVFLVSFSFGTLFVLYLMGFGVPTCFKKILKNSSKKRKPSYSPSDFDTPNSSGTWSRFTKECYVVPKGAFLFSVFYFYQTLSLLLEGDRYDLLGTDLDSWVRGVLLFFNLRIPFSSMVLCPFVGMTAADQLLLELLLYVAVLYSVLLILVVVLYAGWCCSGRNSATRGEEMPFKYRVARAATSIASLSQTNVALSCFYLLHCVDLDRHKVFFYNGNLSCDALRWWQTAAVVVLSVHTVPFIFAVLLRPFYQRRYHTGLSGVLLAYHLPVGYLCFIIRKAVCIGSRQRSPDPRSRQGLKFVTNYVDSAYEPVTTQADRVEDAHVNPRCAFEAANFLLRFLVITMNFFTNWSPLSRAVGNFLLLTLYLLLVFFVNPYGSSVLNVSARVCSVVLNFVAGSQIMYAGFHQAGVVWTRQNLPFYRVAILLGRATTAMQIGGPFLMVLIVAVGWLFHSEPGGRIELTSLVSGDTEQRELSGLSSISARRGYRETTPLIVRKRAEAPRASEVSHDSFQLVGYPGETLPKAYCS